MKKRTRKVETNEEESVEVAVRDFRLRKKLTKEQEKVLEAFDLHDLVFVEGSYGSGKTFSCINVAIQALRKGDFARIVVTRPFIADKGLGALPGSWQEKLLFEFQPIIDNFYEIQGKELTDKMIADEKIKFQYNGKIKGITIQDSVFIVDETADVDFRQYIELLSRLGTKSKMMCTLSKQQINPFIGDNSCYYSLEYLKNADFVGWVELKSNHRHSIINQVVDYINEEKAKDGNY